MVRNLQSMGRVWKKTGYDMPYRQSMHREHCCHLEGVYATCKQPGDTCHTRTGLRHQHRHNKISKIEVNASNLEL
jgi:hypothetical protein